MPSLVLKERLTRHNAVDHGSDRVLFCFKLIKSRIDEGLIGKAHIPAQGIAIQTFKDRSGDGPLFFH